MFNPKLCFHPLHVSSSDVLPQAFTYPFSYQPHPLCIRAARELQEYLSTEKTLSAAFDEKTKDLVIGKMFGVLLVQKSSGELGYLAAFSGKLMERNDIPGFVPPIFDTLDPKGFFKKGEAILNQMNVDLEHHPNHQSVRLATEELEQTKRQLEEGFALFKQDLKERKKQRDYLRNTKKAHLNTEDYERLLDQLKNESIHDHFRLKDLKRQQKKQLDALVLKRNKSKAPIEHLKQKRRQFSAQLQAKIHAEYNFKNATGEIKNVLELFNDTPPSGAGECAAPKLLQFAYDHQYQPLAMAEFWWGPPPPSEVRKHGSFYPSCRGKCEPILGFMMQGLEVDPNPMEIFTGMEKALTILYEDEYIIAIEKPAGVLSVPGKTIKNSVLTTLKELYPEASGPLLVHRLDMSTSGILLAAKDENTHKHLQNQFINRSIKKRYVAVLDGLLEEDKGNIKLPMRVDLNNRPRQLVCYTHGKLAVTSYTVLERKNQQTRVYFYPHTGRTHQLRVHAAHHLGLGAPIVGDDLYGQRANRLHLHAEQITFMHPETEEKQTIKSPCPF